MSRRTWAVKGESRTVPEGAALAALLTLALAAIGGGGPGAPEVVSVAASGHVATGFAAGPGRVVTVAHVLADRGPLTVRAGDRVRSARVLRVDAESDLALLAVPGLDSPPLRTAPAAGPLRVVVPGRARAAAVRRHVIAHVSVPGVRDAVRPALELGVDVESGDSGAPVLAAGGRVAGIVFARSRARPRIAWAVDAEAVRRLLLG